MTLVLLLFLTAVLARHESLAIGSRPQHCAFSVCLFDGYVAGLKIIHFAILSNTNIVCFSTAVLNEGKVLSDLFLDQ